MTSRSGPLSDVSILAHCQRYRPIPLHSAQHILMKDLSPQHEHAFGSKPLKYHTIMSRPQDFDTLAKAITKMSGNPMVRDELNSAYAKDLQSAPQAKPVLHNSLPPNQGPVVPRLVSTHYDSNGNGSNGNGSNLSDLSDRELDEVASNFSLETPHFTTPTRRQDDADLRSNPPTTRKMAIEEYTSSSEGEEYDMAQLAMEGVPRAARTFSERVEDDVRIEEKTASPGMKFPLLGSPLDLGSGFPEKYRLHNLPPGYTRERLIMEEMGITPRLHGEGSSSKD